MGDERRTITAKKIAISMRNYQRARARALTRLAKAYPDIYKAYLEEEKQNDKTQGKTWIDLDGNTNSIKHSNTDDLQAAGWQHTTTRESKGN